MLKKDVVNILISNRSVKYGDILNPSLGLDLKNKYKTFPELVQALDEIIYIIDHLESNGYIEIKKTVNQTNAGRDYFHGIPLEIKNEKAEITANKLHWFVKYINDIYCWEIITKSGLIAYVKNNYKTNDEIRWSRSKDLSLIIVLLTALFTSILTAFFNKLIN